MLILIAEDDTNLRRGLSDFLGLEGFETIAAETGPRALEMVERDNPDFCILDVGLPGIDGFEVCRRIRAAGRDLPILFLTARNEELDRVLGFGLGADDYLAKPFSSRELIARIRAIARRKAPLPHPRAGNPDGSFIMRDLLIEPRALRAFRGDVVIGLSQREVKFLTVLHERAGLAVPRDALYDACWGRSYFPNSRALDQFVAALRRKIERDPAAPEIIATVHGVGYRFDA